MYVCVCKAVTEKDIHNAVENGANCMQHLQSELGVSTNCGSCACDARQCLDKALESQLNSAELLSY